MVKVSKTHNCVFTDNLGCVDEEECRNQATRVKDDLGCVMKKHEAKQNGG